MSSLRYGRVLLKLGGESLGEKEGISASRLEACAEAIQSVHALGVELAIVMGGGNIFRGLEADSLGIERVQGDYMGMLATVINGMALQAALERRGHTTRLMSGLNIEQVCERFIRRRAIRHLEKRRIVIFAAGLGSPYFTTDSTASLRAIEIKADVVLKGTKVDGVYTEDPLKNPSAKRFEQLSFQDAYEKGIQVMDKTAFTLCQENKVPIIVFDMRNPQNLLRVMQGEGVGTLIT